MPTPAPPGGIISVIPASGAKLICKLYSSFVGNDLGKGHVFDAPLPVFAGKQHIILGGLPFGRGGKAPFQGFFPGGGLELAVDAGDAFGDGGAGGILPGLAPEGIQVDAVIQAGDGVIIPVIGQPGGRVDEHRVPLQIGRGKIAA